MNTERTVTAHAQHDVQFYERLEFLAARVAEFVSEGLAAGETVVMIVDSDHVDALLEGLTQRGIDPQALRAAGRLILRDARSLLSLFMIDGRPDEHLFTEIVGGLVHGTRTTRGKLRAYGEMVNVLWREGNVSGAVALERLWNRLLSVDGFPLLCAYAIDGCLGASESILQVCDQHTGVAPAEGAEDLLETGRTPRLVAELQHATHALTIEGRTRRELEERQSELRASEQQARQEAGDATRHLAVLQRLTSALSGAVTPEDVARVVVTDMMAAVQADRCVALALAEGGVRVLGSAGISPESARLLAQPTLETPLPSVAACRGDAFWLPSRTAVITRFPDFPEPAIEAMVGLPLTIGSQRVGALTFAYRKPQEFTPPCRALFEDLARQVGLAVERALLFESVEREGQRAREANRAKDEFMAMLGHELRNPLWPIQTALELMRLRGGSTLERERSLIERQVRNLTRLVDDLLDVSRVTRGTVQLHRSVVETGLVVARAIEMASPLLEKRAHRLRVEVPAEGLPVDADEARLAQVLANLLINAAKYTEAQGEIAIEASSGRDGVTIQIRDNGAGIDPSLLPRMFEPFVQGRRGPDRSEGGLGIGLTVARSLVELHGGTIAAQSDGLGRGSVFTVRLPPPRVPPAPPLAAGAAGAASAKAKAKPGHRILVVDDNRDSADGLMLALEAFGYQVRAAYDAPSALVAALEFAPQLALVDIGLPIMDGYELAEKLREQAGAASPGLVAITGYGQDSDHARSRAAGFHAHLVKPVNLAEIQAVVGRALAATDLDTN